MTPRSPPNMKPTLLILASAAALALPLHAAPLVYDGFDYPVGATLHGQNGGTGFTSGWIESGFSLDYDIIQSGSLPFPLLGNTGNSLFSHAPTTLTTELNRSVANIATTTGTTLWLSFLTRKESAGGTPPGDYFGLVL